MKQRYLCQQYLLAVVFAALTKIVLQVALVLCFGDMMRRAGTIPRFSIISNRSEK